LHADLDAKERQSGALSFKKVSKVRRPENEVRVVIDDFFSIRTVNDSENDSAPLAARGVLLALVMCLHVAGALALLRLSESLRHDEAPAILQASWIEDAPLASPPQSAEPRPLLSPMHVRPIPAHRRVRAVETNTVSTPIQPPSVESSEPVPTIVDAVPAASEDSGNPVPNEEVAAAKSETVGGEGSRKGEEEGKNKGDADPDFNASYLSNPKPEYPSRSRRLHEQGLVKLRVRVTEQGSADEVTLYVSSGFDLLDKAALDTVKRWRFRPAQHAGAPVAGWVIVPVRFELQN